MLGLHFRWRQPPEWADLSRDLSRYRHLIKGITCQRYDRLGGQVHAAMSARLFSHATGIPYFHSPFQNPVADWEEVFNLGAGFPLVPAGEPVIAAAKIRDGYAGPPAIVTQRLYHAFADADPDRYLELVHDFRERLALQLPTSDEPVIAVHIRRGDVARDLNRSRHTGNRMVARYIDIARQDFPRARVRVFSQGRPEDFEGLPPDCELELDTDLRDAMAGMIAADGLVIAKSSLSYVAALLSRGTIYYQPFWNKPLSHWKRLPMEVDLMKMIRLSDLLPKKLRRRTRAGRHRAERARDGRR